MAERARFGLVVGNVLRPDLDQADARVFGGAVVLAVAQVAKPGLHRGRVQLLDAGVVVVAGELGGAGDADPVRRLRVHKAQVDNLLAPDVLELVRVHVCEKEKVGAVALRNRHRARNRADVLAGGDKHAQLVAVGDGEEVFRLLLQGRVLVDLLVDARVGFGTGAGSGDGVGHCAVVVVVMAVDGPKDVCGCRCETGSDL